MKTDDLIDALSRAPATLPPVAPARFPWMMFGVAIALSCALMALWLGFNHEFMEDMALPMFWVKFSFVVLLAASLAPALQRLAVPGQSATKWLRVGAIIVALTWVICAVAAFVSGRAETMEALFDEGLIECPKSIIALSIPIFVVGIWAMRERAPTRLALAGAAVGLFSGAVAATIYAFHCTGYHPAFIAVWYSIGIAVPTVVGALLGRKLLRW